MENKIIVIKFIMLISILFLFTCAQKDSPMNKNKLVILNSKIWTGNTEQKWAKALAVDKDKIIANPIRPLAQSLDHIPFPDYDYRTHYILNNGSIQKMDVKIAII